MHVIARAKLHEFIQRHPDAGGWLNAWWNIATRAEWSSLHDVRRQYPDADQFGQCLIFNVRGNNYRFIVTVCYAGPGRRGTLFVKEFLTHAEYDKNAWKGRCQCKR